ncbi:MAG: hypothetical protein H8E55_65575 [Pelagibacterales bacterium]|nr:hypothetical protein [Pelagibacterales bacterium]
MLKITIKKNQSTKSYALVTSILICSHIVQVFLFILLYFFLVKFSPFFGAFSGTTKNIFLHIFYYLFNCYTTLGMGDVFATGPIRIIAVLESLIGLIMIAWSASLLLSILLNKKKIS